MFPDLSESIMNICRRWNVPIQFTGDEDINSKSVEKFIADPKARLIIYSGLGGQIVSERIIRVAPPLLHLHSGWLPKYRGSTTIYYSLLNGELPAVSAILLNKGIDTGPLIMQKLYPNPPYWVDIDQVYDPTIRADLLCRLMIKYVANGTLKEHSHQSDIKAHTYYVIHPVLKHLAIISSKEKKHA